MRIVIIGAAILALGGCNRDATKNNNAALAANAAAPVANSAPAAGAATPSAAPKATVQQVGMPFGRPLGPLLEEDQHSPGQTGCNAMFTGPEGMYVSVIASELMVRTPAGRQICSMTDAQIQSFGELEGEVSCAGVRMSVSRTGAREASVKSDSSSAPATLSATQDGVTATLDGTWGTAC